jgi:hypothetical protein
MRLLFAMLTGLVAASLVEAATFQENFSVDPTGNGWKFFGNTNLFKWDSNNQNLRVIWDSSQTNSYFLHPLGTVLARDDSFSLAFDLRLEDILAGVNPNKTSTFQIAVSLFNLNDASRTNFFRGAGIDAVRGPRSLVEFDYFPASSDGINATVSPLMISSNNQFAFNFTFPLELTVGDWFHVEMTFTATNKTLATSLLRNGQPFDPVNSVILGAGFSDFRLDTVAVCSYSDAGQTPPEFAGSILAYGVVDNLVVTLPPPPVQTINGAFSNSVWQVRFLSRSNWLYTLERTADLKSWTDASPAISGNGAMLTLPDPNPPDTNAFYRVRANRP